MHYVYVLKSLKDNKHYIGYTQNIAKRFLRHNQGGVKSTKRRRPFELIYKEGYQNIVEAKERERQIKRFKGGEAFRVLISVHKQAQDPIV